MIVAGAYEQRLLDDFRWALSEGSRHFDEKSAVSDALRKIARRLDELQVPYAIVGGMALFKHGFRRFTDDVDVLVRKADLKLIHDKLEGLGYLAPHKHSKHLRDTENGVKIEFLTTGDYPGDGREKPVAFPDPDLVGELADSIKYIKLEKLIELKLASGMTGADRLKDLADVMELIKLLNLHETFADRLHPYVQGKFKELWKQSRRRFVTLWRNRRLTPETLETMKRDGVTVESDGVADDYVRLVTTDPDVAKKYDMVEESEFWGEHEEQVGP